MDDEHKKGSGERVEEIPWRLHFVLGIGDVLADAQSLLKVLTHFGQLSLEISARAPPINQFAALLLICYLSLQK